MKTTAYMVVLVPAAFVGCASITPRLGFDQVQHDVSDRTGLDVRWDTDSAADQEAKDAIAALLKKELTAESAMQIALLNNRELQAIYQELHVAQADLVQAGLLKNPVFNGGLRFATTGGPPAVDLGIAQDFISLLSIPLRKARAQAAFESAKFRVTGAVLDLAGEVRGAFYETQADEQLREMRQTVLEATAASYELAKRVRAAGNNRDLDVSNERALNEQSKVDLASAEIRAQMSRSRLNELMGLWGPQTQWTLSARLPDIPIAHEDNTDTHLREALSQSLDLKVASTEIEVAARALGITEATRFINEASIGISAEREVSDNRGVERERRREAYDQFADAFNSGFNKEQRILPPLPPHGAASKYDGLWSLGPSVSIPIPIFDQGQATLTSDHARLKQAVERYYALAVRLRARLQSIEVATQGSRNKAVYFKAVIIPLRHKIVEETQLQFNAMQVSAFQLLQAKRDEIGAGADYIEELRGYWLARSKLDLIRNGRLPSQWRNETSMNQFSASDGAMNGGHGGDQ